MNKYSRLAVFLNKTNIATPTWKLLGFALLSELLFWLRIITSTTLDAYYTFILSSLVIIATVACLIPLIKLSKPAWKFLSKKHYLNYLRKEKPLELLQLIKEVTETIKFLEKHRDYTLEFVHFLSITLNALNTMPPDRAIILLIEDYETTINDCLSEESYEKLHKFKESKDIFTDLTNFKNYSIAAIEQLKAEAEKISQRLITANKIKQEAQTDLNALLDKIDLVYIQAIDID